MSHHGRCQEYHLPPRRALGRTGRRRHRERRLSWRRHEGRGWTSEADLIAGPRIDEAGFLALLAKDASVVLLGLRDGDLGGCVPLEGSEDGVAFLGMLSVRVSEQGSGLGRALVAAAEDYARRELGARVIAMYVLTVRRELLAWYERRGYRRTGDIVPFHSPPGQRFLRGPLEFDRLEKRLA